MSIHLSCLILIKYKMKNLARKSLVAIGLMMSLTTLANDGTSKIKENEKKVTNMRFENVAQGSTLTIKDVSGLVLYNEAIKQTGDYSKGFDLTSLPNGDYFFELNLTNKLDYLYSVNLLSFQYLEN